MDERKELEGDTDESLSNTFSEYCPDTQQPPTRKETIDLIIEAMRKEGHIKMVKLADIARDMNINPKVARDKMRKAQAKNLAPQSSKPTGWVFNIRDRQQIEAIIRRKE